MAMLGVEGSARPFLNAQSFPSIDPRIGWALTVLSLLIALLLTLGVLRIQIGPLPGSSWLAIICAQVVTAVAVAGAAQYSRRRSPRETEAAERVSTETAG